ncbi:hypothetical protein BX600DRAFT_123074 [Xylariales sp. PMI_506]|nr:hypothetical protein BX600DRAFT_123074 [Xylariales sp. PMI_506]
MVIRARSLWSILPSCRLRATFRLGAALKSRSYFDRRLPASILDHLAESHRELDCGGACSTVQPSQPSKPVVGAALWRAEHLAHLSFNLSQKGSRPITVHFQSPTVDRQHLWMSVPSDELGEHRLMGQKTVSFEPYTWGASSCCFTRLNSAYAIISYKRSPS